MNHTVYYCYDAYCGWCYGFSPVIKKIAEKYSTQFQFEVLSGGMIIGEQVKPIARVAAYIEKAYKRVEETTGIKFGEDFLWHIRHPEESDWQMNSEKPAIAMNIFKEYHPGRQVDFAADLQYALNYEGRDLDDDEAYRQLLEKYGIQPEAFYSKLQTEEYKERAYEDFAVCKQLQVSGYPAVLLQVSDSKFHLLASGFTHYEELNLRITDLLKELGPASVQK